MHFESLAQHASSISIKPAMETRKANEKSDKDIIIIFIASSFSPKKKQQLQRNQNETHRMGIW